MAKGKLVQSEANVHSLLNDKDAMRKLVEDKIQEPQASGYEGFCRSLQEPRVSGYAGFCRSLQEPQISGYAGFRG